MNQKPTSNKKHRSKLNASNKDRIHIKMDKEKRGNSLQEECRPPSQHTETSSCQQKGQRTHRRQIPMPEIQQQPPPAYREEAPKMKFKTTKRRTKNYIRVFFFSKYLERMVGELPSMLPHFLLECLNLQGKENQKSKEKEEKITWVCFSFPF